MRAVELHVLGRAVLAAHDHAHRSVGVEVPHHVVAVFVTQVHIVVVADEERRDRVLEQELLVVLLALDDEVCHRHGKRRVGAGLDGDELVGKSCRAVEDQTDVDDLRAAAARLDQVLGDALLVFDGVGAPHDDVVGRIEVCRIGRHVLVEIAHVEERRVERAVVKTIALDWVGGAPQAQETRRKNCLHALARRHGRDNVPHGKRLGAVLVADLEQLLGDLVHRLVPADLFPLALAALAYALERVEQALGVVRLPAGHDALLADVALVGLGTGVVGLFGPDDLAVFDDGLDRAELVVAPAGTAGVDVALSLSHGSLPFSLFSCTRTAGVAVARAFDSILAAG